MTAFPSAHPTLSKWVTIALFQVILIFLRSSILNAGVFLMYNDSILRNANFSNEKRSIFWQPCPCWHFIIPLCHLNSCLLLSCYLAIMLWQTLLFLCSPIPPNLCAPLQVPDWPIPRVGDDPRTTVHHAASGVRCVWCCPVLWSFGEALLLNSRASHCSQRLDVS